MKSIQIKLDLKVIDCTAKGCTEAVLLPSIELSNTACDIGSVIECLTDVSHLLGIIQSGKLEYDQVQTLARLTQVSTEAWADILYTLLKQLNQSLEQTKFKSVEVQS